MRIRALLETVQFQGLKNPNNYFKKFGLHKYKFLSPPFLVSPILYARANAPQGEQINAKKKLSSFDHLGVINL